MGCGVGNTVYPLLEANPLSTIYAVDYSARAIEELRNHDCYDPDRVHAHVLDISKEPLASTVPVESIDFCTSVFVLSALSPGSIKQVGYPSTSVSFLITLKILVVHHCLVSSRL